MNARFVIILAVVAGGLALGCLLPLPREPVTAKVEAPVLTASAARSRHLRREELLAVLLDDRWLNQHRRQSATTLAGLLGVMRESGSWSGFEAERMVEMDPASAMAQVLSDPALSHLADGIAEQWARRDPVAAIRFLSRQSCYAAESGLCKALVEGYRADPRLVGETLREKGRRWQARNLKELFTKTWNVRIGPLPPPQDESSDPFANGDDDAEYRTARFGDTILDCLADDELRDQARACWEPTTPEEKPAVPSPEPEPPPELGDFRWDAPWSESSGEQLTKLMAGHPEETLAEVAAKGCYEARSWLMECQLGRFPHDKDQWPEALEKLEELIVKLEVVPGAPPRHFEMGPILFGPAVAEWIARQPLALQRAWSSTFTQTWAGTEPEQALNWARSLPPGANGELAAQNALIIWAHQRPVEAARYVEALPPGDLRESAISNTAATWSCLDPDGAKAWLNTLPDSAGKTRGLGRVK